MTTALPVLAEDAGLGRYLDAVKRIPYLEPKEEFDLAVRWRDHRDAEAAHKIVLSHLRFAAKLALKYRGYGLPVSDLISEANIGLIQAINRFEPERGFKFATLAMWWVRAQIQEYVLKSWSLVKIGSTSVQKKLFFGLRKAKSKIAALGDAELSVSDANSLATTFGVPVKEVLDMDRRLRGDASLNVRVGDDGDGAERIEYLVDDSESQETLLAEREEAAYRHEALNAALDVLNPRERRIFVARRLSDDPDTLETLAGEYGISRERVRQIEVSAFDKVKARAQRIVTAAMKAPANDDAPRMVRGVLSLPKRPAPVQTLAAA